MHSVTGTASHMPCGSEKHCCQYATDGSGSETNPEGFSHTVAIACTIIETDDRLGYMFCNPLAAKVQHFGEFVV